MHTHFLLNRLLSPSYSRQAQVGTGSKGKSLDDIKHGFYTLDATATYHQLTA